MQDPELLPSSLFSTTTSPKSSFCALFQELRCALIMLSLKKLALHCFLILGTKVLGNTCGSWFVLFFVKQRKARKCRCSHHTQPCCSKDPSSAPLHSCWAMLSGNFALGVFAQRKTTNPQRFCLASRHCGPEEGHAAGHSEKKAAPQADGQQVRPKKTDAIAKRAWLGSQLLQPFLCFGSFSRSCTSGFLGLLLHSLQFTAHSQLHTEGLTCIQKVAGHSCQDSGVHTAFDRRHAFLHISLLVFLDFIHDGVQRPPPFCSPCVCICEQGHQHCFVVHNQQGGQCDMALLQILLLCDFIAKGLLHTAQVCNVLQGHTQKLTPPLSPLSALGQPWDSLMFFHWPWNLRNGTRGLVCLIPSENEQRLLARHMGNEERQIL